MTVEEIQARYNMRCVLIVDNEARIRHGQQAHEDCAWLLAEYAGLTQELEKLDDCLLKKQDRIDELTRELAEERAACTIAGHAMDAMRKTIERKDEEIRLLRDVVKGDRPGWTKAALEAFDKEHHA